MNAPTPREITSTPWPVATQDLLADAAKLEATHAAEQVNQPLFALIKARRALNDARLALMRAQQYWPLPTEVRERLNELVAAASAAHDRFPLTVINRRKTWRDAAAWATPPLPPETMTTTPRKRTTKLERPLTNEEANAALHRVVREMLGAPKP